MDLWRRCILLLIISSEKFTSITAATSHTLLQSRGAFKLGKSADVQRRVLEQRQQQLVPKGYFGAFFSWEPQEVTYSKQSLRFVQELPLHTEVWYPLVAEANPKVWSAVMVPLSHSTGSPWPAESGGSFRWSSIVQRHILLPEKRGEYTWCNYFICQWLGIYINAC